MNTNVLKHFAASGGVLCVARDSNAAGPQMLGECWAGFQRTASKR